MKNLDFEPGFWLTVMMLIPFMVVVEVLCRFDEWDAKRKQKL